MTQRNEYRVEARVEVARGETVEEVASEMLDVALEYAVVNYCAVAQDEVSVATLQLWVDAKSFLHALTLTTSLIDRARGNRKALSVQAHHVNEHLNLLAQNWPTLIAACVCLSTVTP